MISWDMIVSKNVLRLCNVQHVQMFVSRQLLSVDAQYMKYNEFPAQSSLMQNYEFLMCRRQKL